MATVFLTNANGRRVGVNPNRVKDLLENGFRMHPDQSASYAVTSKVETETATPPQ